MCMNLMFNILLVKLWPFLFFVRFYVRSHFHFFLFWNELFFQALFLLLYGLLFFKLKTKFNENSTFPLNNEAWSIYEFMILYTFSNGVVLPMWKKWLRNQNCTTSQNNWIEPTLVDYFGTILISVGTAFHKGASERVSVCVSYTWNVDLLKYDKIIIVTIN